MALLSVEALKKSYLDPEGVQQTVIDIPRFELEAGKQLALEGASGSGKTTFLNLIAGILKPDSGRVVFDGQELSALSESARDRLRAGSIGYVFQTFNLLQGYSALENLLLAMSFGPGGDEARARELLERVGLSHRSGYRPGQLSVGQQQRVALARALANRPKLVLADEPTGNLDPALAREALGLLRELCEETGAALLIVSHDLGILEAFKDRLDLAELNAAAAKGEGARK